MTVNLALRMDIYKAWVCTCARPCRLMCKHCLLPAMSAAEFQRKEAIITFTTYFVWQGGSPRDKMLQKHSGMLVFVWACVWVRRVRWGEGVGVKRKWFLIRMCTWVWEPFPALLTLQSWRTVHDQCYQSWTFKCRHLGLCSATSSMSHSEQWEKEMTQRLSWLNLHLLWVICVALLPQVWSCFNLLFWFSDRFLRLFQSAEFFEMLEKMQVGNAYLLAYFLLRLIIFPFSLLIFTSHCKFYLSRWILYFFWNHIKKKKKNDIVSFCTTPQSLLTSHFGWGVWWREDALVKSTLTVLPSLWGIYWFSISSEQSPFLSSFATTLPSAGPWGSGLWIDGGQMGVWRERVGKDDEEQWRNKRETNFLKGIKKWTWKTVVFFSGSWLDSQIVNSTEEDVCVN